MNILVTNLSRIFKKQEKPYVYEVRISDSSVKSIEAFQTNESIFRALATINSLKEKESLDKIIVLVSNLVINDKIQDYNKLTTYEYYLSLLKELFPNATPVQIKIENEDNSSKDISEVLDKICSEIQPSDSVYIDAAGGQRNFSNIIQLLTKILNYKGIKNPYTLYADIQNKPAFIGDTSEFQKMTKLADAFNEFMTTGKSRQLSSYYSLNMTIAEFNELLKLMNEFSDKIQLGDIDNLEETIIKIDACIKECEKVTNSFNIGTVILKQFLPVIRNKLIGNLDGKVDYLKIIEWCVENNLIQQALTLFVEKIPIYLFETRVITYSGNILEARKNFASQKNPLASNWDSYIFYSEILEQKENLAIEKIKSSDFNFGSFKFNASSKKVAEIYYAYIYTKMLRNGINHASYEEKFTFEQKNILKEYGFDFEHFSVTAVRRNIKNALEIVKQVSVKNDKQVNCVEEKSIEPENYSTDLKVGDKIEATCTEQKIARIEGYNYDIQLVIPPAHNAFEYVDNKLIVEIKQISKKGKIVQVGVVKIL